MWTPEQRRRDTEFLAALKPSGGGQQAEGREAADRAFLTALKPPVEQGDTESDVLGRGADEDVGQRWGARKSTGSWVLPNSGRPGGWRTSEQEALPKLPMRAPLTLPAEPGVGLPPLWPQGSPPQLSDASARRGARGRPGAPACLE